MLHGDGESKIKSQRSKGKSEKKRGQRGVALLIASR
jgi:hypothetical protein